MEKQYAQNYHDRGLVVIPLDQSTKAPSIQGWSNRTINDFQPEQFELPSNLGVVLGDSSGGLVDIDIDSSEALKIASLFLPPTDMVFGRASKPRSHHIYRCPTPGKTQRFRGRAAEGTIIECRGNGAQTVFPPSIHPSGETVAFENEGEPADVEWHELSHACRLIATAVEVSHSYVAGKRHDIALALSGALLTSGVEITAVENVLQAICVLTNDDERTDRLQAARDTHSRVALDQGVQAWSELSTLIDTSALRSWFHTPAATVMPSSQSLAEGSFNDEGNAKRTLAHCENDIIFVPEHNEFHVWEEGCSVTDSGAHETTVKCLAALNHHISDRQSQLAGHTASDPILKFLWSSKNASRLKSQIELLKPLARVPASQLDADEMRVACRNGVLDLKSQTLLAPEKGMFITKQMDVRYDPNAKCPQFQKLLSDMFNGNSEKIDYLQRYLAYCLTGRTDRHVFVVLVGPAASGKSTLVNVIREIMGDYATDVMAATLFESLGGSNALYDIATLQSCRFAVAQEAESRQRLNASLVKTLTGGDAIKARLPYQAPTSFSSKAKIMMVANTRPDLDVYDDGLQRRIVVVEAEHSVPREKIDYRLREKLRAEKAGILNFLLEGLQKFKSEGLRQPPSIKQASKGLFSDKDDIRAFLDERCVRDSNAKTLKSEFYDAYTDWCAVDANHERSQRELTQILRGHFQIEETRDGKGRYWKGLKLTGRFYM